MLWQGQEFADNWTLPPSGRRRISFLRNTHWEYFYDDYGVPVIRIYRRMAQLRRSSPALRSRESFYYWQESLQGSSLVAYHRHAPATTVIPEQYAMVVLNFGSNAGAIQIPFPKAGTWVEMLDADIPPSRQIVIANAGDFGTVQVPYNYGLVFIL